MNIHQEPRAVAYAVSPESGPRTRFQQPADCPVVSCSAISLYENELEKHEATEAELRRSVLRESALLRQKDELIQKESTLRRIRTSAAERATISHKLALDPKPGDLKCRGGCAVDCCFQSCRRNRARSSASSYVGSRRKCRFQTRFSKASAVISPA